MNEEKSELRDDGRESSGLSNLLNLIDFEIDQIHKTASSAGFNFWIIIAGLSACVWALFSAYETRPVENEAAYRIVLFFMFALMTGFYVWGPSRALISKVESTKLRFIASQSLTVMGIRLGLLFLLVGILAAFLLSRIQSSGLLYMTLAYAAAGILVLNAVASAVLPHLPISREPFASGPHIIGERKKLFVAIQLLICIPLLYLVISTASQLIQLPAPITLNDLRVSTLVMAIIYLLWLLSKINIHNLTLRQLTDIRRNLILANLPPLVASKQVEIALMGLSMADHVLPIHAELLEQLQRYDREMDTAKTEIHAFKSVAGSDNDPAVKITVAALVNSITHHLSKAANIMIGSVFKNQVLLRSKLRVFGKFYPLDSEVVRIARKLAQDEIDRVQGYNSAVHELFKEIERTAGTSAAANFIADLNAVNGINFNPQSGKPVDG
jgi:hypothetical protein